MTDLTIQKGLKDYLKQTWKRGLNELDGAMVAFSMICVFDNVRKNIKDLLSYNTPDKLYRPRALFTDMAIPCFNMGLILSRKKPFTGTILEWYQSEKKDTWSRHNKKVLAQYFALALVISGEIMVDVFRIYNTTTSDSLKEIKLKKVIPVQMINKHKQTIDFVFCGNFYFDRDQQICRPKTYSEISLIWKRQNQMGVIMKLLPLLLLDMKFDQADVGNVRDEFFGKSSVPVLDFYNPVFWENCPKSSETLQNDDDAAWVRIKNCYLISPWWSRLTTKKLFPSNFNFDQAFMKLAACHSKLNCFDEAFDQNISDILNIVEVTETDTQSPVSSPAKSASKKAPAKSPPKSTGKAAAAKFPPKSPPKSSSKKSPAKEPPKSTSKAATTKSSKKSAAKSPKSTSKTADRAPKQRRRRTRSNKDDDSDNISEEQDNQDKEEVNDASDFAEEYDDTEDDDEQQPVELDQSDHEEEAQDENEVLEEENEESGGQDESPTTPENRAPKPSKSVTRQRQRPAKSKPTDHSEGSASKTVTEDFDPNAPPLMSARKSAKIGDKTSSGKVSQTETDADNTLKIQHPKIISVVLQKDDASRDATAALESHVSVLDENAPEDLNRKGYNLRQRPASKQQASNPRQKTPAKVQSQRKSKTGTASKLTTNPDLIPGYNQYIQRMDDLESWDGLSYKEIENIAAISRAVGQDHLSQDGKDDVARIHMAVYSMFKYFDKKVSEL